MNRKKIIDAALGNIKADLVIKNTVVIDVLSHTYKKGDVAVCDGIIVGVGEYEGIEEIDAEGAYTAPGLIDTHIHIESTMLTPSEFAEVILTKGVTTVFADPHEIANVCGSVGLEFMLEDAKNTPLDIKFMLPSCVPATPFDNNGCTLSSDDLARLYSTEKFYGLAEMMNYPGVLTKDEEVLKKLDICRFIDGHAPLLNGKQLNAYSASGVRNDHECSTVEEALEKISAGMDIFIREGTGARNLECLVKAVNPYNLRHFTFCTDDKEAGEIIEEGTITNCIKKAVEYGLDPLDAYTIATINAANIYSLENVGAVAPGYVADLIITKELTQATPDYVFKKGKLVAKNGEALFEIKKADNSSVIGTVKTGPINYKKFTKKFNSDDPVIRITLGSLITELAKYSSNENLSLCVNMERHHATGNTGVCYVSGFKMGNGAVAQTIGHDCHNITAVGSDAVSISTAIKALGKNGGIAVVNGGEVTAFMELKVAGLMSDKPAKTVAKEYKKIISEVKKICPYGSNTLMMILSFISLTVIPHIKLTDRGLFDVDGFKFFGE